MLRLVLIATVISLMTAEPSRRWDGYVEACNRDARYILYDCNNECTKWKHNQIFAEWNYVTNMTEENREAWEDAAVMPDEVLWLGNEAAVKFLPFPRRMTVLEHDLKRQFEKFIKFAVIHYSLHEVEYFKSKSMSYISLMKTMYNDVQICNFKKEIKCYVTLEKIINIMMRSRDPEELKQIWVKKRISEPAKIVYSTYVKYANIVARSKYFPDQAAHWISKYEVDDFPEQIETLWQQLKPLYLQLHAYVRRELRKKYGENIVSKDGPIPAHLLGLLDTWKNIANFTTPFPDKQLPDVTRALRRQGYNATSIFRLAEGFFKSINLSAMTDTFWKKSIMEKPKNVDMDCAPMAFDFYNGKDFRIKQCTDISMQGLLSAHHIMGHIEYFMQYKDQPIIFKEAANPGFYEAVSDLISLSVSTPGYLKKIGLLKDDSSDREASLNYLYLKSLEKIAVLPFAYMVDLWRWNVFQGKVTLDNYNCHWWSLAAEYQGIEPPVDRSEEDFDPAAIYYTITDVEYIRYFVSAVIQFQFHKALCIKAKQYDPMNPSINPLHKCDIYGNMDAGNLLQSMMKLGSSKPWPDAMEKITGQKKMDAAALLEYFQPLMDWLTEENKKTNEYIGWKPSNRRCIKIEEDNINDEL